MSNNASFDDERIDLNDAEYTAPGHDNALMPGVFGGGGCMECELMRAMLDDAHPTNLFPDKTNRERLTIIFEAVQNYIAQLEINARQLTAAWEKIDNLQTELADALRRLDLANDGD